MTKNKLKDVNMKIAKPLNVRISHTAQHVMVVFTSAITTVFSLETALADQTINISHFSFFIHFCQQILAGFIWYGINQNWEI